MVRAVDQGTARGVPPAGGYAQAIWRRKLLVVAGLVVGLALGALVLPKARTGQATYQATIRLKIAEQVSDTIVRERPQFDNLKGGQNGDGNALQDVDLAGRVLAKLGAAAGTLEPDDVAARLTASPVNGSSFVDLVYTDTDPARAGRVLGAYAKAWATRRNALDAKRLHAAINGLEKQTATVQGEVARLSGPELTGSQQAELARAQARFNALVQLRDEILRQQLFLGPPTAVLGSPVITQVSAPTPRVLVVVFGVLLGLLAAAGLSMLLEAARPKVLAPADVERATGVLVIASVPSAGMRGDLPVVKRPFSPAAEGYRRVAGALERRGLGEGVRLVAVASADPGEGKSLLSLNVAHALARQGRDVVLVSADLRRPRLDKLVGLEGKPGLAEWLQDARADSELPVYSVAEHLMVIPAGKAQANPGELLTTARLRQGLRPLAAAGFAVLIDTPPALWSAEAMTLAAAADATLLVARARTSRWRAIEQLAEGLRRDGVREIGMVLLGDRRALPLSARGRYAAYSGRHQPGVGTEPPATEGPWDADGSRPEPAAGRGWFERPAARAVGRHDTDPEPANRGR